MTRKPEIPGQKYAERDDEIDSMEYCGIFLIGVIVSCGVLSTIIISRQNRQTR
ncbi:MAG: hypothetical protein HC845_07045 [Akkermansiaceae bacterium]|nr:hypothetical protein [Akkermansiaceae bacterium]